MALKNIYEMTNIVMADETKYSKYLVAMPEGCVDFPSAFKKIPSKVRKFSTVVIGEKTREVGQSAFDDLTDEELNESEVEG
jgi:hypothetical protein